MSDSLRDQLIAAGFEAKKEKKKPVRKAKSSKSRPKHNKADKNASAGKGQQQGQSHRHKQNTRTNTKSPAEIEAAAEIEKKKKLKAQIKELIDTHKVEKWQGETAYRYQVGKRLRELYVSDEVRPKLVERDLAITRLNGATYLVPAPIARQISEINPLWSVFNLEPIDPEATLDTSPQDDDYKGFEVPDDLTW